MDGIWDHKTDAVCRGDNLRTVIPVASKTRIDENGFSHYIFNKVLFNNPHYIVPSTDLEKFKKFLDGGSRMYPSDGSTPCDIVAKEARIVLNDIVTISKNKEDKMCDKACRALEDGKLSLVRGTMKVYLGKYTNRDWRRKRFTDDIDFWTYNVDVLEHSLKRNGWTKNKITKEWEKEVSWDNPFTNQRQCSTIVAANDTNMLLDFGAGSYLEGSNLREVMRKKLKRGHDVDLSDIINIALENGGKREEEWKDAWKSFEEAANTRSSRITSNIISLCRYASAVAEHLIKIGNALNKYHKLIFDKEAYKDDDIKKICQTSIHWMSFFDMNGPDKTREILHDFLIEQATLKPVHSKNLLEFVNRVLELINSKYAHHKIIFEIEE
ncbi:MAG: hypothetical protein JW891_15750 [Candidatus Lokiarchaeota archaeon]|nr:hypothetical protein [Candidatus Lokiarchaeota archaeon]